MSLLGNDSVKIYRGKEYTRNYGRIVGPVVFYAVRVILKENRRPVLLRISYFFYQYEWTKQEPA
jgi:hypothetical protein